MNLIKQTLKIFCTKIIYNILISILMLLSVFSISDYISGIQSLETAKQNDIKYANYENYLYVQDPNLMSPETVSSYDFLYSPKIHTVYKDNLNINWTTDKLFDSIAYDPFIFDFSEIVLLSGRLPSYESETYEILCPEGLFELGATFDVIDNATFTKAEVVGIMTKESRIKNVGTRHSLNPTIYPFNLASAVNTIPEANYTLYHCIAAKREGVSYTANHSAYLEYPKDIYNAHKDEINRDITGNGLEYLSIGQVGKNNIKTIKDGIKTSVLITLASLSCCILLLILIYHNLLSSKSKILGTYLLVGYSKQQINIMLVILSLFYLLIASILIPVFNTVFSVANDFHEALISILLMIPINAVGLIYALIAFNRKKAIDLIKEDSEK